MDKKAILISVINILLGIVLFIIGFFLLPETVVVQISISAQNNSSMPKIYALIIPLLINLIFSILYWKIKKNKYIFYSLISYFGYAFLFFVNLM